MHREGYPLTAHWVENDGATLVYDPNTDTYRGYIQVLIEGRDARLRGGKHRVAQWKGLFMQDLRKALSDLLEVDYE